MYEKTSEELQQEMHAHSEKALGLFTESQQLHRAYRADPDKHILVEEVKQFTDKQREAIAEMRQVTEVQNELLDRQRKMMRQQLQDLRTKPEELPPAA